MAAETFQTKPDPNCQRSTVPLRYTAKPHLVINLTKIGSTLNPEERPEPAGPAYRGTHILIDWSNESTKNRQNSDDFSGEHKLPACPVRQLAKRLYSYRRWVD